MKILDFLNYLQFFTTLASAYMHFNILMEEKNE